MAFPLRSPFAPTRGLYVFARIVDKIRLAESGGLPSGYNLGVIPGKRTFDDRLCRFLGVDFDDFRRRVLEGGTDEEVLDWCFEHGCRPDEEKIEVWNGFMSKRGWRDNGSDVLAAQKRDSGLADRDDVQTFFDLIDADEGRPLHPRP